MNNNCLQLKNIRKDFGPKTVLEGITLSLQKEEILGLVGPNGAGKTTLIKIITGLIHPTSGSINICIISILSREPVKAGVLAGVAGLALSVPGLFPAARYFSVFYQMRAVEYYVYGEPLAWSLLAGLFTSGVLLILGFSLFKKRDF